MTDPKKLDLDALAPPEATVTIGGKDYNLRPPALSQIIRLSKLSSQFEGQDASAQTEQTLEAFKEILRLLAPELAEVDLTIDQSTKLIEFIMEMAVPPESQYMAERGMQPTSQKKTSDSVS